MKNLINFIISLFSPQKTVQPAPNPAAEPQNSTMQATSTPQVETMTLQEKVYLTAKLCLGKHITLNDNVPHDVGCAEAVSYVLKKAGVRGIPDTGFAGTYELWQWLKLNATQIYSPRVGAIIISPTGTSTINSPHGHVGCVAKFGILSNNSDSGLFTELWTLEKWNEYYHVRLGFPVYYFMFP